MALERSVSLPVAVSDSQSKSFRFSNESKCSCVFSTKNEFSLQIPEMVVSRVVFAESEAALLFVKLYCIWFSFYISIK